MITQQQLDEAILEEMGRPNWDIIRQFLAQQVMIARDSCAEANSWEEVLTRRGFAQGLVYVIELRDQTKIAMENQDAAV